MESSSSNSPEVLERDLPDESQSTLTTEIDRPQVSIRLMMVITALVGVYLSLGLTGRFEDLLEDWGPLASLLLGGFGFGLLIFATSRGRYGRVWPGMILAAAIAYGIGNIALMAVVIAIDSFMMFDRIYLILIAFVGPGIMVAMLMILAAFFRRLDEASVIGASLTTATVAFMHVWITVQIAASI